MSRIVTMAPIPTSSVLSGRELAYLPMTRRELVSRYEHKDRNRQLKRQQCLTPNETLKRIRDDQARRHCADETGRHPDRGMSVVDVVFLVEHARGDGACRHACRHTTR